MNVYPNLIRGAGNQDLYGTGLGTWFELFSRAHLTGGSHINNDSPALHARHTTPLETGMKLIAS